MKMIKTKVSKIQALIKQGHVMPCPFCDGLNCYSPAFTSERHNIVRFSCTSCFDWQCGHCKVNFTREDSIINSKCFTHKAGA